MLKFVSSMEHRHRVPPHGMEILHDKAGKTVFFDHLVNTWLLENKWKEDQVVSLAMRPEVFFPVDDSSQVEVATLHCRLRTSEALSFLERHFQRPEDWVFVQYLPHKAIEERHFFEFVELERLADEFRRDDRSDDERVGSSK